VINGPASLTLNVESGKQLAVGIDDSSDHSVEIIEVEIFLALEPFELVTKRTHFSPSGPPKEIVLLAVLHVKCFFRKPVARTSAFGARGASLAGGDFDGLSMLMRTEAGKIFQTDCQRWRRNRRIRQGTQRSDD
jgi:hypothetical protein